MARPTSVRLRIPPAILPLSMGDPLLAMRRGVTRALRLDLFLGQGVQHPLHGRAVGGHLAALEIGLGEFQLPQRVLAELVQNLGISRAQPRNRVRRQTPVDLRDEALLLRL